MHTPVKIQVWRIALLMLEGTLSYAILHMYTAFRSVVTPKKSWGKALDFLVGFFLTLGLAAGVFVSFWGQARYYVPLALGAGYMIGQLLAEDFFYRISRDCIIPIVKKGRALSYQLRSLLYSLKQRLKPPR